MTFRSSTCLALVLALGAISSYGASSNDAERSVAQVCSLCHGRDGNSTSPLFPRLAGQSAAYIDTQLKAFRAHQRADPPAQAYMWGMASQLDNVQIANLAAYFAARPVKLSTSSSSTLASEGKAIYETGVPAQGIPACASCHGDAAEGRSPYPRLRGQHPEYLLKQLQYFKSRLRSTEPVMLELCDRLTEDQMRAVVEYAASR
jgi:cytochrome c553